MLNGFFSECFNTAQPPLSIIQEEPWSYLEPSNLESIDNLLCTEDEVYEMIISLDTSKANGSNGISARMLKGMAHSITPVLTHLFNMSIEFGIFSDKWKLSSVVPIPKGSDHSNPSNYRPISLLSVISKMLERHVYCLIAEYLSSDHPLANTQWGFQSGKSTVSALLTTTRLVCKIRSRQRSLLSFCCFFLICKRHLILCLTESLLRNSVSYALVQLF